MWPPNSAVVAAADRRVARAVWSVCSARCQRQLQSGLSRRRRGRTFLCTATLSSPSPGFTKGHWMRSLSRTRVVSQQCQVVYLRRDRRYRLAAGVRPALRDTRETSRRKNISGWCLRVRNSRKRVLDVKDLLALLEPVDRQPPIARSVGVLERRQALALCVV